MGGVERPRGFGAGGADSAQTPEGAGPSRGLGDWYQAACDGIGAEAASTGVGAEVNPQQQVSAWQTVP